MNSVDKLFKDKLAQDQLAPGPKAWEKLEGNLSKKNRTIVWFRLAAVMALMSLLTIAWLNWQRTPATDPSLTKKEVPTAKEQATEEPINTGKPLLLAQDQEKKNDTKDVAVAPNTRATAKRKKAEVLVPMKPGPLSSTENQTETLAAVTEVSPTETVVAKLTPAPQAKKAMVITYSLPALPSVPANDETVAAATDEEQQKGIQKIWEAAKDVKNSDNPWGDLREAKNELLAFDFKKEKKKQEISN